MKKKIVFLSLILALVIGASLIKEVIAAETETETVFDMADLLTDSEEEQLRKIAEKYEKYDVSVVFMTTEDTGGKTTQNFSNDFYDTHSFHEDGVMFSVDMQNREIYIDTVGKYIAAVSDNKVEQALDDSYLYASEGEYALCLTSMSQSICKIIDAKENPLMTAIKPSAATIFVMLAAAAIVGVVLLVKHNKANRKISASHYIGSSFKVKNRNTVYMGCRKEVIPGYYAQPKDSGGGGSSSHRSSGGVSHGGGGRKF